MTSNVDSTSCRHCGRTGVLQAVTDRIGRCRACDFLIPTPMAASLDSADAVPRVPGVAPGGVLRGRYRLLRCLGEGAHGVSYLARHEDLRHPCVVKLLPHRSGDGGVVTVNRLREEARSGFEVQDPNVVRVLDCDVAAGVWYFVMEYVDGVDLGHVLGLRLHVGWRQAVRVGVDAAQGLTAIHGVGLVHRDIKPANLLLGSDNSVRVADLGVAALATGCQESAGGAAAPPAGTLPYAPPEAFRPNARLHPTADLYSLGATLFHLITGRPPHATASVFQRLVDLQCRPVTWPVDAPGDVPAALVQVVLRLLAIEPEDRIPTAAAVLDQLRPFVDSPVAARPPIQRDELSPRGIGVLPLRNETSVIDDDWLGYAVADSLCKGLAALPDAYVADLDVLAGLVNRLEAVEGLGPRERLLEAGRRVGAATLITGRFRRDAGRVRVVLESLRGPGPRDTAAVEIEGPLGELPALERALLERLTDRLGLGRPTSPQRPRTGTLAAREKFVLGRQAYLRGDYEEAIALAKDAIRLDLESAESLALMGICLARLGRYDEAEACHRRHEALARERADERGQIEALANLGVMYYFRGDYAAAEQHYRRAVRLAEQRDLATETAQVCNNLGFVLYRRGRLEEAEKAFLRAIETHRAYGGLTSLVGPYNGMGNVLAEAGRFQEARDYYQRALALATETGDRTSVGTTHVHLGRCAAQEGRFADAKHELTMALNALEETRFWNGLARAYEVVTDLHLQMGDCAEALRSVDKRIDVARQHANVRMEAAAWQQKAAVLRAAGRPREAEACAARACSAGGGEGGDQGERP